MNYPKSTLLLLLLLLVSVTSKGTTRDKTSVIMTQAETAERTKGVYDELKHFEQEMEAKAGRQGLSPQGQADQARSEARIQAAMEQMRKYGQQETPPTTTEQESRNIVKAETEIGILAKNALEHAGETPTAPPPIQSNLDTSALVAMQKEASAIKKVEANPVTALPEMTTVKRQQHEHDARKQYDALKAEDAYMTDMIQAGDVNSRLLRMRPRAFFPPTAPRSAGPVPDPVDPYAPKQITVGMNVADLARAGSGPVVQQQTQPIEVNTMPKRRTNIPAKYQSYDTIPLSIRAKPTQRKTVGMKTHAQANAKAHLHPRVSGPTTHATRQTQQLRTHSPSSTHSLNPRQEYIQKYAPLRKGVTDTYSVQTALQNMQTHIQPQVEDTDTVKIVETLNKAADTVKALTRDENVVEIDPIQISVDSQRIAEKVHKVNKEFDELIRDSQVSAHTVNNISMPIKNNEDSLLIKNTEKNVKEAKEALKKLIEQSQQQETLSTSPTMPEQNDIETSIPVSDDTKEIVTKEPQFESWLDRAKRLTTKFIPKYDTVYTDGTTVPKVPKVSDFTATGDEDDPAAGGQNTVTNVDQNVDPNANQNVDPNANQNVDPNANQGGKSEGGMEGGMTNEGSVNTETPPPPSATSTASTDTTTEEEDEGLDDGEVVLKKGTVNKQLIKEGLEKLRKDADQLNANIRLAQSKIKLLTLNAQIRDDTRKELELEKKAKEDMKARADKHQNEVAEAVRNGKITQSIMSAEGSAEAPPAAAVDIPDANEEAAKQAAEAEAKQAAEAEAKQAAEAAAKQAEGEG